MSTPPLSQLVTKISSSIDSDIYHFFNVDTGAHFLSGSKVIHESVINNLDAGNLESEPYWVTLWRGDYEKVLVMSKNRKLLLCKYEGFF